MEENKTKIFWKTIDGGELKGIECFAESDDIEFEPLEEPIVVKYDPTYSLSFDVEVDKCNIRKLFYTRIPRKKKKMAKKWLASLMGDIYYYVKHLRYNYNGSFCWIK